MRTWTAAAVAPFAGAREHRASSGSSTRTCAPSAKRQALRAHALQAKANSSVHACNNPCARGSSGIFTKPTRIRPCLPSWLARDGEAATARPGSSASPARHRPAATFSSNAAAGCAPAVCSSSSPTPVSTAKPGAWPPRTAARRPAVATLVSVRRDARGRQRRLRPVPGAAVTLPSRTPRPAAAASSSSARERTHLSRPSCDGSTRPLRALALAAHGDRQSWQTSSSGAAPGDERQQRARATSKEAHPSAAARAKFQSEAIVASLHAFSYSPHPAKLRPSSRRPTTRSHGRAVHRMPVSAAGPPHPAASSSGNGRSRLATVRPQPAAAARLRWRSATTLPTAITSSGFRFRLACLATPRPAPSPAPLAAAHLRPSGFRHGHLWLLQPPWPSPTSTAPSAPSGLQRLRPSTPWFISGCALPPPGRLPPTSTSPWPAPASHGHHRLHAREQQRKKISRPKQASTRAHVSSISWAPAEPQHHHQAGSRANSVAAAGSGCRALKAVAPAVRPAASSG
nr:uncharacterized protein LOC127332557 [Lolium perenne]